MLKINLMIFGLLISLVGIFGYTEVYGADWKFLKANVEGDFFTMQKMLLVRQQTLLEFG
jgi:hypothetical protein